MGKAAKLKDLSYVGAAYLSDFRILSRSSWGSTEVSTWQCLPVLLPEER